MKYTYIGTDERVFPSLGLVVKPGDEIEAPDGFAHPDFVKGGATKSVSNKNGFNPNAKDGDKDGFVQDGTIHERPVSNPSITDTKAGE